MLTKASSRRAAVSKSLMRRLAPLETGLFLPIACCIDRPIFDEPGPRRSYSLGTCFGLGFASSCIPGGVALLILLLLNPVGASMPEIAAAPRVSTASLLPADLSPAGRQLWWKLPLPDGHRFASVDPR